MSRCLPIPLLLLLILPLVYSCGGESKDSAVTPGLDPYRALTVRDNLLFNLQKSWTDRNLGRYDELLDDDFVFNFSEADVDSGYVTLSQWDRVAEMAAAANMFDPNFSDTVQAPVINIYAALWYPVSDDSWQDVVPDQVQYPGETWYTKVFWYDFKAKTATYSYVGLNLQGTLTVRRPDGDGGVWQIVAWSDNTESQLQRLVGASSYAKGTTWGKSKSRFSD